jgi:hypothetical protein
MGITLLAVGALVAPLHQLLGGFGRTLLGRNTPSRTRPFAVAAAPSRGGGAPGRGAPGPPPPARSVQVASGHGRPARPLRVRRAAEPLRSPASAGRMVISGRMADVCAELDRLAAVEATARPLASHVQVAPPSR